jgi:biopolymer transport protein ExbD
MKHADGLDPYIVFLRRRLRGRHRYDRGLVEPAAIANVCLLMLVFFLYASGHVVRLPGVRLTLPEVTQAEAAPFGSLVLAISREGLLFLHDERTGLDELRERFARAVFDRPGRALVIEADEFVQTATLMRVVDLARAAGLREIILAGRLPPRPGAPEGGGGR